MHNVNLNEGLLSGCLNHSFHQHYSSLRSAAHGQEFENYL